MITDEQRRELELELDDARRYADGMRRTAAELRALILELAELRAMLAAMRGEKPPAVTVLH